MEFIQNLVSKLPIRQLTQVISARMVSFFSKLPIRQLTGT